MRNICVFLAIVVAVAAVPWDCWSSCGYKGGPCEACEEEGRAGRCCRTDRNDGPGCASFDGCLWRSCCSLGDCWSSCGYKAGNCNACPANTACCRKGYTSDPIECGFGVRGCNGYHCCDTVANDKERCGNEIDATWRMIDMKYDVEKGTVKKMTPKIVGTKVVDNRHSTITQDVSFTIKESHTETQSFTTTAGASISLGTSFSVGVPEILSGTVSYQVTASIQFSSGKVTSETKERSGTYNCRAPAGKIVTCTVEYSEFKMDVPYTSTWVKKDLESQCRRTNQGIFTQVSAFQMHMNVDQARVVVKVVE